jgi:hypothetical protein
MIALGRGFALNYLSKFRTPVTVLSPSVAKGAAGSAAAVFRMGLTGFPALCRESRCFAADGRRDAVDPRIPERR